MSAIPAGIELGAGVLDVEKSHQPAQQDGSSPLKPAFSDEPCITATSTIHHHEGHIELPILDEKDKAAQLDIEHRAVTDDPRLWSDRRKFPNLAIISITAIAPTLGVNIYNREHSFVTSSLLHQLNGVSIKTQLHATEHEIALSLSIFIFVQGFVPLIWSAVSEIVGRKAVYIVALGIYAIGCTVAALAHSMGVLIGMRILQAAGASAALTLGSGTIADMYDTHERGARVGVYYAIPLLGPSLGPMLGGILVQVWNWRATFWCMVILAGCSSTMFLVFKETFRKERSLAYQAAKKRAVSRGQSRLQSTQLSRVHSRDRIHKTATMAGEAMPPPTDQDLESNLPSLGPVFESKEFKVTLADVNPIGPAFQVLRHKSNVCVLFASGILFGYSYGICYTCARTFAAAPYSFSALKIGAVLLSFGMGNVSGSVFGGRWSDQILARLKAANGGIGLPEMRLQSVTIAMSILPLATIGYGWTCEKNVHVAAPVVFLFIAGFSLMWGYSSTLAYIVDSNPGRAISAVAMNSCFRGLAGLVVAEISAPMQDAVGDGVLYTIWGGILALDALLVFFVSRKGALWREQEVQRKLQRQLEALEKQQQNNNAE